MRKVKSPYLSSRRAAALLGLSVQRLNVLRRKGALRAAGTDDRGWYLYSRKAVERFARERARTVR